MRGRIPDDMLNQTSHDFASGQQKLDRPDHGINRLQSVAALNAGIDSKAVSADPLDQSDMAGKKFGDIHFDHLQVWIAPHRILSPLWARDIHCLYVKSRKTPQKLRLAMRNQRPVEGVDVAPCARLVQTRYAQRNSPHRTHRQHGQHDQRRCDSGEDHHTHINSPSRGCLCVTFPDQPSRSVTRRANAPFSLRGFA